MVLGTDDPSHGVGLGLVDVRQVEDADMERLHIDSLYATTRLGLTVYVGGNDFNSQWVGRIPSGGEEDVVEPALCVGDDLVFYFGAEENVIQYYRGARDGNSVEGGHSAVYRQRVAHTRLHRVGLQCNLEGGELELRHLYGEVFVFAVAFQLVSHDERVVTDFADGNLELSGGAAELRGGHLQRVHRLPMLVP